MSISRVLTIAGFILVVLAGTFFLFSPREEESAPPAESDGVSQSHPAESDGVSQSHPADDSIAEGRPKSASTSDVSLERTDDPAAAALDAAHGSQLDLARAFLSMGNAPRALRICEALCATGPASSQAWTVRGRALLELRRPEEAMAAFARASEIDPQNIHALNNQGYIHILRGDFGGAVALLRRAVDAARETATTPPAHVWNNLGIALEATGDIPRAEAAFGEAVALGHHGAALSRARVGALLARRTDGAIPFDSSLSARQAIAADPQTSSR